MTHRGTEARTGLPLWDDLPGKQVQILKAAVEVFRARGFHEAKVEDIAAAAGVGKGTIYEYFSNKTDLFEQTVKYHLTKSWARAVEYIKAGANARERIRRIIESEASFVTDERMIPFLLSSDPERASAELKHWKWEEWAHLVHRALEVIVEQGIDEGSLRRVDTRVAACFIFSMFHVILSACRLASLEAAGPSDVDGAQYIPTIQAVTESVMDILMNGLAARP